MVNREDKSTLRRQWHIENKKSGYAGLFFSFTFGVSKEIIAFRFTIASQLVIARLVPGNPVKYLSRFA